VRVYVLLSQDDDECLGFASLPEQVHRKAVKRGFDFTVMVVGAFDYNPIIRHSFTIIIVGVKPISQLRFDHDTTVIRRYHDAFDYDESDRNYDLRSIRL